MYPPVINGDESSYLAEPINGRYITPNDYDDYCLHCAQPLVLAPTIGDWGGYWFHASSKRKHCLVRDIVYIKVQEERREKSSGS